MKETIAKEANVEISRVSQIVTGKQVGSGNERTLQRNSYAQIAN